MHTNRALKALCSIPVIIIISYFFSIVSACLMIARYFVYDNKKYYFTSFVIMIIGFIFLLPKAIAAVFEIATIETVDTFLWIILDSNLYIGIFNCGRFLFSSGIILLVVSFSFRKLFYRLVDYIKNHFNRREEVYREVSQKNDMEIRIKQEKSKATRVVYCPFCGADNLLFELVGKCKYCRKLIKDQDNI